MVKIVKATQISKPKPQKINPDAWMNDLINEEDISQDPESTDFFDRQMNDFKDTDITAEQEPIFEKIKDESDFWEEEDKKLTDKIINDDAVTEEDENWFQQALSNSLSANVLNAQEEATAQTSNFFSKRQVSTFIYGKPSKFIIHLIPPKKIPKKIDDFAHLPPELRAVKDKTLDIVGVSERQSKQFKASFASSINLIREHLINEVAPLSLALHVAVDEATQTVRLLTGDSSVVLQSYSESYLRYVINLRMLDILIEQHSLSTESASLLRGRLISLIGSKVLIDGSQ